MLSVGLSQLCTFGLGLSAPKHQLEGIIDCICSYGQNTNLQYQFPYFGKPIPIPDITFTQAINNLAILALPDNNVSLLVPLTKVYTLKMNNNRNQKDIHEANNRSINLNNSGNLDIQSIQYVAY